MKRLCTLAVPNRLRASGTIVRGDRKDQKKHHDKSRDRMEFTPVEETNKMFDSSDGNSKSIPAKKNVYTVRHLAVRGFRLNNNNVFDIFIRIRFPEIWQFIGI